MRKATHRENPSNRASAARGPRIEKIRRIAPPSRKAPASKSPSNRASAAPAIALRAIAVRAIVRVCDGASGGVARAEGCACRRRRAPAETRLRRRGRARLAVGRRCEYARARVAARLPGPQGARRGASRAPHSVRGDSRRLRTAHPRAADLGRPAARPPAPSPCRAHPGCACRAHPRCACRRVCERRAVASSPYAPRIT
jgi:hypothetical protein